MAEKLTQAQIDELLNSLKSPAADETPDSGGEPSAAASSAQKNLKVKTYDFRNPKKFTKEQLRTLFIIYDNYSKHLSSFLSGFFRTDCHVSVLTVEEQRYYEYNNALPESILMAVIDIPPLEGNMLIDIPKPLAYSMIDRLLGGTGDNIEVQNDFSEIELNLMDRVLMHMTSFLQEAWAILVDTEPVMNRIETNSRLTQIMPLDEIVIIVILDVTIKDIQGNVSICVPCINLESMMNGQGHFQFSHKRGQDDSGAHRETIFESIKPSKLEIHGVLGGATLTINDLMNLQVGDVLSLNEQVGSPVTVKIGDKEWFHGDIGTRRNKIAVKVNTIL